MRVSFAIVAGALLLLCGCESTQPAAKNSSSGPTTVNRPSYDGTAARTAASDGDTSATTSSSSTTVTSSTDKSGTAGPSPAEPDNTAVNERDASGLTKTPIDQNENQRDINITAEIRKAVLARENMSLNARNVKIITADGKVTLRGPVDSAEEKEVIEGLAKTHAGQDNVTSELEVKADK
jgi:hyperosmotically inducible periplasmic protein